MSKNTVEEIVEEILPLIAIYVRYVGDKVYVDDVQEHEKSLMNQATCNARTALKQALTEGKLVVPMSEEEILKHFERYQEQHEEMNENSKLRAKCAKELYEAQFGGNK